MNFDWIFLFFTYIGSYVLGAVPTGFIIARMCGISDIRKYGSGNIGATNVGRTLGISFFCIILFLDAGKAFANLWLLKSYTDFSLCLLYGASIMHLIGNAYSPFLGWTGGKGGAAATGLLLAFHCHLVIELFLLWIFLVLVGRNVGIASVSTALILPFLVYFSADYSYDFFVFCLIVAAWISFRHSSNIKKFFQTRSNII